MSDWTAPDFLDKLETALNARTGITTLTPKVRVLTYYPSVDEPLTDAIIIGFEVSDTNEPAALGQVRYTETVDVDCEIRVVRPGAGSTPAKAARDRCKNLLGEIDNELRTTLPDVGDQTLSAHVASRNMAQFAYHSKSAAVRVCLIEFVIQYKARTSKAS